MRLCLVLLLLFLAGCATAPLETKGYWQPQNALQWEDPRVDGITLNYEDGSTRYIAAQVIDNLITAHDRLLKATARGWTKLALVDVRAGAEPLFHAFMTQEPGGPVIAVSVGLLDAIGNDPDALAAVLSHEMAHINLGHSPAELKAREEKLQQSQQVGAGLSTGPAALAALVFRVGALVHYRSLTRDEERAADEHGLHWAVKAGFDPCGMARALEATRSLGVANVPFFSTHPGGGERRELANRYSREVNNRDCPEPGAAPPARAGGEAPPEPAADRAAANAVAAPQPSETYKRYAAAMTAARAGDFATAVPELRSLADAGYAPAQTALGYWYLRGYAGLPKDEVEGGRWTRLAAEQRHAAAQSNLGQMYLRGSGGLDKDAREAVRLFRLSAEQGHRYGQTNLGLAYLHGLGGVDRDALQAARYFKRAADQDEPLAQANLGWIHWNGANGIPKDAVEAVRLFRLSAEQNHPSGQTGLARMYFLGAGGLAKDEAEALRLNRLAAEQGDSMAQNNLGAMRENGQGGLPKDVEEAVMWYRRAAAQGNRRAIENLKRLAKD